MNNQKQKLLVGTHNQGKLDLIKRFLQSTAYHVVSLSELDITFDVEETGVTFEENALLKARHYFQMSGVPTVADDGGLEVDALQGEPGVYSSRYAGPHKTDAQKVDFLLEKVKDVPEDKRTARFVSVIALALSADDIRLYKGVSYGTLALAPQGTPVVHLPYRQIFIPEGHTVSMDELDDKGIAYITHRDKAFELLLKDLAAK